MKKVTIYSSNLGNGLSFETDVTTFGQLQTVFMEKNISYQNMKVVVGETRVTLEHPDAVLPSGDFKIFLLPTKTKSGSLRRSEIYAAIKNLAKVHGVDYVKEKFGNYTQKRTEDLLLLLKEYSAINKTTEKVAEKEEVANPFEVEVLQKLTSIENELKELREEIANSTEEDEEEETVYNKEAADLLDFFE